MDPEADTVENGEELEEVRIKSPCNGSYLAATALAFETQRLLRKELEESALAAAEQPSPSPKFPPPGDHLSIPATNCLRSELQFGATRHILQVERHPPRGGTSIWNWAGSFRDLNGGVDRQEAVLTRAK
ncbi:hypothetical protein FN846DRAFT_915408 [Sphaerosporella brunnea]|uniref:Uncharacterized protein n=1 Tax=Sphaerosporella brunnea TaxID=1250544 RepID=A0A5J5FBP0_9PEZI|nr:hypothetical protein FN846DRAFT_915408 [Sphaerosporella brunnea]